MISIQNYIGGRNIDPVNKKFLDNYNPATGTVYGQIPDSDAQDIELAVEAAKKVQAHWAAVPLEQKCDILLKISTLILDQLDALAEAETMDNGKPLWLSRRVDIPRAAQNFKFFATALMHFASESYFSPPTTFSTIHRVPVGIVGCISPWNLPLYLFTWKIAPALAAGNCVIAKPSEVTPLTASLLGEIFTQAGLPDGVLNIIHGTGPKAGNAIIMHKDIKAISFTGGTSTGAHIARSVAPMFKKLSLELGGKNAAIICNDCDYELMLRDTVRSSFTNQGQICLCTSRLLVQSGIYEKFKTDFVQLVEALTVGNPYDPNIRQGAIVSQSHLEKISNAVNRARSEGGIILTGGEILHPEGMGGYYYKPTVIEGLGPDSLTNCEEIFGPVVTLQRFNTMEEAITLANATEYGLATTIWARDTNTIHCLSEASEAGIVWVNCWLIRDLRTPFGGVKSSGVGREGGWEAMRFFTEAKSITQKMA